ncbi:MAG: RNA 3'-terminal phosphate cyclase [Nanoarchaeota archaeon]
MIEIDGQHSGGQSLRSALSLSVYTGKPFKIINIRGKREEGGLKHQHLAAVNAMAYLCNAKVIGAQLGSKELEFYPGDIDKTKIDIDIKTAGSSTLILQTIIPACLNYNKKIKIDVKGGTDTTHCPMSLYFMQVFCDFLYRIGLDFKFDIKRFGFYPKGGGELYFELNPNHSLKEINYLNRGNIINIDVHAVASKDLEKRNVINRIIKSFEIKIGGDIPIETHENYVYTLNTGCFIHSHIHYENYKVGDGVLGEPKKMAEDVGRECAEKINKLINSNGVDKYAVDQLMIYMAIKGKGKLLASEITDHVLTNKDVIEKFLPVKFDIKNKLIECINI